MENDNGNDRRKILEQLFEEARELEGALVVARSHLETIGRILLREGAAFSEEFRGHRSVIHLEESPNSSPGLRPGVSVVIQRQGGAHEESLAMADFIRAVEGEIARSDNTASPDKRSYLGVTQLS